jgi:hypothetical protein
LKHKVLSNSTIINKIFLIIYFFIWSIILLLQERDNDLNVLPLLINALYFILYWIAH